MRTQAWLLAVTKLARAFNVDPKLITEDKVAPYRELLEKFPPEVILRATEAALMSDWQRMPTPAALYRLCKQIHSGTVQKVTWDEGTKELRRKAMEGELAFYASRKPEDLTQRMKDKQDSLLKRLTTEFPYNGRGEVVP